MQKTKVAILGAGFITDIHVESYHRFKKKNLPFMPKVERPVDLWMK
jgi:hypothetical protein